MTTPKAQLDVAALEHAIMHAPSAMFFMTMDPTGTIVYVSDGVRQVLGREPEQVVGDNILDWLTPEDAEVAARVASGVSGAESHPGVQRFRFRRRDGSLMWLEVSGAAHRSGRTPTSPPTAGTGATTPC